MNTCRRKFVQVSSVLTANGNVIVYAICEEGRLWVTFGHHINKRVWTEFASLPEIEEKE